MKKILDLFKSKKSKVVEELTRNFDKKLKTQKKADEEYYKEKNNNYANFENLMHDDFYHEIDELMKHFDLKLNPLTKAQKCGFKVDKNNCRLEFYSNGYDEFPVSYTYTPEKKEIYIRESGNDGRRDKSFSLKDSREAEKYFLKLMTKHMESMI